MLFASDLDNTLIHSYKNAKSGDVCVEVKDQKELSFMSSSAHMLLKKVATECIFVPLTTRSLEQYKRIDLGVKPKYAVVAHGALLIVDDQIDEQWASETRRIFNKPLPQIRECDLLYDIRYVDTFFLFSKSDRPIGAVKHLKAMIDTSKFEVCSVRNKVYIFPIGFNKGVALERLKRRLQCDKVICAGDSVLDVSMLEIADVAISPKGLQFNSLKSVALDGDLFEASVLDVVNKLIKNNAL